MGTAGQPVNFGTMAHDHEIYMILADTAVEMRDSSGLYKYAPLLEELANRDKHKLYLAIAHRAYEFAHRLEGKHAEAETQLKQALELFTKLGARWQIGRTLFELGELNSLNQRKRLKPSNTIHKPWAHFRKFRQCQTQKEHAALNSLAE